MIRLVSIIAIVVFALIGAGKVGFFSLLWKYIKGLKQKVCPLVEFGER